MGKNDGEFSYRGDRRTTEDVTRRSRQTTGLYDGIIIGDVTRFKVKEGENTVRILPPSWSPDLDEKWGNSWEIQVYLHYGVGPDSGSFLCLDKMKGERCPVCEARREAADDEERGALAPSWRALCWVVDRDNEKAGPQIWDMPATLFRDINARSIDKKSNSVILIDAPGPPDSKEDGYDLIFTREGTNLKTKYVGVEVMRDPSPLHDNEKTQKRWLDYIKETPLPEVLLFQTAEYIEKVLSGRAPKASQEDGDGGYERTSRRGGRRDPAEEGGEEQQQSSRRTRARVEAPEEEDRTTTRRRSEPEADSEHTIESERESRTTRRRAAPADEEARDTGEEAVGRSGNGANTRGRPRTDPQDETNEDPPESRTARRGLERLRGERRDPAEEE